MKNDKMEKLDRYDLRILDILQKDASLPNHELADKIGLSPSPCSRRIKQLIEAGYISKQVALLNPKKLGLTLTVFVLVGMDRHTPERFEHFQSVLKDHPEIVECCLITGMDADYQLKVIVPDIDYYQKLLLGVLTRIEGVASVRSCFVLNQVISKTEMPLNIMHVHKSMDI